MKKLSLLLFIGIMSSFTYGQSFETNITVSPLATLNFNEKTTNEQKLGFAASAQEFYNFSENFALGVEITYSYEKYGWTLPFNTFTVGLNSVYYRSSLTLHSLNVPLALRFRTNSNWSINLRYGFTHYLSQDYSVHCELANQNGNVRNRTEVDNKSVELENDVSTYAAVGFGKEFRLNDLRILTEVFYNYSFSNFNIQHEGAHEEERLYGYNITPQHIGLRLGIGF
ncbi:outer membrane beta-barrel protein [Halocola ammonii]